MHQKWKNIKNKKISRVCHFLPLDGIAPPSPNQTSAIRLRELAGVGLLAGDVGFRWRKVGHRMEIETTLPLICYQREKRERSAGPSPPDLQTNLQQLLLKQDS